MVNFIFYEFYLNLNNNNFSACDLAQKAFRFGVPGATKLETLAAKTPHSNTEGALFSRWVKFPQQHLSA